MDKEGLEVTVLTASRPDCRSVCGTVSGSMEGVSEPWIYC